MNSEVSADSSSAFTISGADFAEKTPAESSNTTIISIRNLPGGFMAFPISFSEPHDNIESDQIIPIPEVVSIENKVSLADYL